MPRLRGLPYPADDDKAAQEFIARTVNMRSPHPRVWPQLLADDRIEQTARVLVTIKEDTLARFTKRRDDNEALNVATRAGHVSKDEVAAANREHRNWHARAVRYDAAVTQRLREAKAALKDARRRTRRDIDEVDIWKSILANVAEAIYRHEQAIEPADAHPDDKLLWARLDLDVLPGGGTLRDFIGRRIARMESGEAS